MKMLTGQVVSVAGEKSVLVLIETQKRHSLYQKVMRKRKKYHVHDSLGVSLGEKVVISECRPISKMKRWKVVSRVEKLEAKSKKKVKSTAKKTKKARKVTKK